jgi:SAM-dependent methyltransferase
LAYVFDEKAAKGLDAWYRSDEGRSVWRLQSSLMFRLLGPRPGERLLDVGCGSGLYLQAFKREGLDVTGLDPSKHMLDLAETRLGTRAGLFPGRAEDLPFEDNEFDIVTLITTLEFVADPETALAEAFRVAKGRVYIGVLNSWSLTAFKRRIDGLFRDNFYRRARFYSPWELWGMIRKQHATARIKCASVGLLTPGLTAHVETLESSPWIQGNPFGAYLGLTAHIKYSLITDNLAADTKITLSKKATATHTPTARGWVPPVTPPRPDIRPSHKEVGP